jgi:hypothetical protein
MSAIKTEEFFSARMSYIVMKVRWCNIIAMNVHAPSEEKIDNQTTGFMEN